VVRHAQLDAGGSPAGAVQHQHHLLGGTGPHLAGERGSFPFNHRHADGGWQMGQRVEGPTRGWMDKADQRAPGEAVLDDGHGSLAPWGPDAPQQRFEADPVLIGGRDSPTARPARAERRSRRPLPAGGSFFAGGLLLGVSERAWRGRGTCRRGLARTRERQPRWVVTGWPRRAPIQAAASRPVQCSCRAAAAATAWRSSSCRAGGPAGGFRCDVVWRRLCMPAGPSVW
jgi:hypothetical protein